MPIKIGELSTASGTTIESIRFYEREGLIAEPSRTDGNYRVYGDEHVQRLVFIRRCRSLDLALAEIRELLAFKDVRADRILTQPADPILTRGWTPTT